MSKQKTQLTVLARIILLDSPTGKPPRGRHTIRGARRAHSLQWSAKYKEEIISGRDWDLGDPNELAEFEAISADLACMSHEYYFPIVRYVAVESSGTDTVGGFRFTPAVQRYAEERQINLEDIIPHLIPTGKSNSPTRDDIDRAELTRQALFSRIEQRYDPKGADALRPGSSLATTQLIEGTVTKEQLNRGAVAGIRSGMPYSNSTVAAVEDVTMEELLLHTAKSKTVASSGIGKIMQEEPELDPAEV